MRCIPFSRMAAIALLCTASLVQAQVSKETATSQRRCGWWENPTPGNAWLNDRDGSWTVGTQGGRQAEGDWPSFTDAQWVHTNGHYGYGCACLRVVADADTQQVQRILSAVAKPLAACRLDRHLHEPKR